ncbi:MAG: PAS domain S-box protein [Phycisphaerales bacterium]
MPRRPAKAARKSPGPRPVRRVRPVVTQSVPVQAGVDGGLSHLIEHMPVAVAMLDRNMRYVAVSRRWISDYNLQDVQLLGRGHYEIFPEVPQRWKDAHQRALSGENVRCENDRFERADGSVQHLRWEVSPWYRAGHPGGIIIVAEDITAQRAVGEALRDSHDLLRSILDTVVDAVVTADGEGKIVSVNPAAERIFGWTAAQMLGQSVSMLMPAPHREEHDGYVERFLRTGEKRVIGVGREVRGLRKDGTEFPAEVAVNQVDHRPLFVGLVRDITERKRAEAKVRASDRMALLGTLAAGLGHDMNNVLLPVRARLGALTASGREGWMPEADREHVAEVQRSVGYLQQLADSLHYLALDPEAESEGPTGGGVTDLAHWWDQAGPMLCKAVPEGVQVESAFAPGLPGAKIAPHALTQAALNLIVNAGEAMPPDAERPRSRGLIRVWAQAGEGGTVHLGVSDNGLGMTEEVQRQAFDIFFTTKARGLGTGLGLFMVRRIAERAGGRAEIETHAGKGTTVTLVLPAGEPPPPRARGVEPAARETASRPREPGIRVLCVDDHALLVEGLKAHFAIDGRIQIVGRLATADDLVHAVARLQPDVVLLDIEMPGPDVFETADRMRRTYPALRFVFLSAHVRDGYLTAARQCGAWGYFAKSDDLGDISAGIASVAHGAPGVFVMGAKVRERCGRVGSLPARAGHRHREQAPGPAVPLEMLTDRELEVLRLIGKGRSRNQIAAELCRSAKTIDGHQERMMKKLGVTTRADLLRFAIREGLAEA